MAKDDFGNRAFIGTKTLLARPMTRGEYNAYRGWQPPAGEDQGDVATWAPSNSDMDADDWYLVQ